MNPSNIQHDCLAPVATGQHRRMTGFFTAARDDVKGYEQLTVPPGADVFVVDSAPDNQSDTAMARVMVYGMPLSVPRRVLSMHSVAMPSPCPRPAWAQDDARQTRRLLQQILDQGAQRTR